MLKYRQDEFGILFRVAIVIEAGAAGTECHVGEIDIQVLAIRLQACLQGIDDEINAVVHLVELEA